VSVESGKMGAASTLLTPDEAAAYLRVCAKTLRSIRQRGLIRYVAMTPRKILYRLEDCDAYLASCVRTEVQVPTRQRGRKSLRGGGNVVSFSERRRARQAPRGEA
jgi:hypothetical protein